MIMPDCRAAEALTARAEANGIEALTLTPAADDFNADLRLFGCHGLIQPLRVQPSNSRRRMSRAFSLLMTVSLI